MEIEDLITVKDVLRKQQQNDYSLTLFVKKISEIARKFVYSMELNLDNLKRLIDDLRVTTLFDRLFRWHKIKDQLIDANGDLQKLAFRINEQSAANTKLENLLLIEQTSFKNLREAQSKTSIEYQVLKESSHHTAKQIEEFQHQIATLTEQNKNYFNRGSELAKDLASLRHKLETAEADLLKANNQVLQYNKNDEFRRQEHSNAIASLKQVQESVQRAREQEIQERNANEIERITKLKETWINHEENVKNRIKIICSKHAIDYVEKVPFKGKPDNTLKINDEFIIFDAKSPANEDLSNFPYYVKSQAESAIKYVKEEGVRREVFLVVPTNTLDQIEQFEFRLADYSVYVISLDSLEPIILALRKIEDYEFAEQLSPEERENICRVIGKFVHLSKRRIQIDGFFAKQFFELVYRSEADLPKEILEKVVEFERAEKLNPPIERRAKQISTKELENDTNKLNTEADQKGILTQQALISREINKVPLYTEIEPRDESQPDLFSGR